MKYFIAALVLTLLFIAGSFRFKEWEITSSLDQTIKNYFKWQKDLWKDPFYWIFTLIIGVIFIWILFQ